MDGVGAAGEAVPPFATVNQFSVPPLVAVASSGTAAVFTQYSTGVGAAGAAANGFTTTVVEAGGEIQLFTVMVTL